MMSSRKNGFAWCGYWAVLVLLAVFPVTGLLAAESDEKSYWTEEVNRLREGLNKAQGDLGRAQARVAEVEVALQAQAYGESCEGACLAPEVGCPDSLSSGAASVEESFSAQTSCGRLFQSYGGTSFLPASCARVVQACGEVRDLRALAAARASVEASEATISRVNRELAEARRERARARDCEDCGSRARGGSIWRRMFAGGGGGFGIYMNLGGGGWGMNPMMAANPYIYNVGQLYNPYGMGMYGMLPNVTAYLNPYMGMNGMMMNPMMSMYTGHNPMAFYQQQIWMTQMQQMQMMQMSQMYNPMMSMYANPWVHSGCFGPSPWMYSQGFNPMMSMYMNPMMSQGFNPMMSMYMNPMMSQGFNPMMSMYMNPMMSQGYNPWMMSSGHNPFIFSNGGNFLAQSGMYQQQYQMQLMWQMQQQQRQQQDMMVAYQQMMEAQMRYQQTSFGGGLTGGFGLGGSFSGGRLF